MSEQTPRAALGYLYFFCWLWHHTPKGREHDLRKALEAIATAAEIVHDMTSMLNKVNREMNGLMEAIRRHDQDAMLDALNEIAALPEGEAQ